MKKKKIYRKQQVKTITNTPKSAPDFRTPPSPLSFSQSSVESNLSHFPYFNLIHLHVYCYIETCIQKKKTNSIQFLVGLMHTSRFIQVSFVYFLLNAAECWMEWK